VELLDVIRRRKTTNGPFLPDPVAEDHQRLLMEAAGRAPSQLNSQPWRFVVIGIVRPSRRSRASRARA
jgi:nitroreductase